MADTMNAREQLEAAACWLAYHHESLNFGLKNAEDGLKLWRYWMAHEELPEFCDDAESPGDAQNLVRHTVRALGYDPWKRAMKLA